MVDVRFDHVLTAASPISSRKWTKDRGKDPEDAPWYHLFNGDRINEHHLTVAEKRAAREPAAGNEKT